MSTLYLSRPGIDYIGVGVGAIILDQDKKVLLQLRGAGAKNERGLWEVPGGAVEFGESLENAVVREIKEELGVDISIQSFFRSYDHILPDEKQHWVTSTFLCSIQGNEKPQIQEPYKVEKFNWFSIEEALKLPLSKATIGDLRVLRDIANTSSI